LGLLGGLALCCLGFPPKCGLDSVGDSRRQLLRPLVNGLVGAPYGPSGSADTSAKLIDGFMLVHSLYLTTVKNQRSMNKRDDLNHG
jgi:hypothetical protein